MGRQCGRPTSGARGVRENRDGIAGPFGVKGQPRIVGATEGQQGLQDSRVQIRFAVRGDRGLHRDSGDLVTET